MKGLTSEQIRIRELEYENQSLRRTIEALESELAVKVSEILSLRETVKTLTSRVTMNSSNSSKPPSSDGYRKPKPQSLRKTSGKQRGGQPGHPGHRLEISRKPDEVVEHLPVRCRSCPQFQECVSAGVFECDEERFVLEAITTTKLVKHCAMHADCPCGYLGSEEEPDTGSFPEDVGAYVQYGRSFVKIATLLGTVGAVSDSRNSAIIGGLFDVTISPGTIVSMTSKVAEKVQPAREEIKKKVQESEVAHFDETGARCGGGLVWVHTSSTEEYTYQTVCVRHEASRRLAKSKEAK